VAAQQLDRCPFCGAVPFGHFTTESGWIHLLCGCGAKGPRGATMAEARELWNRRTLGRAEVAK